MYNTRKPVIGLYAGPVSPIAPVQPNTPLVLRSNLFASHLLDSVLCNVTKSNHAGGVVSQRKDQRAQGTTYQMVCQIPNPIRGVTPL